MVRLNCGVFCLVNWSVNKVKNLADSRWLWCSVALLTVLYGGLVHQYYGQNDDLIALFGFSALDFSSSILFPENFIRDYPGGAHTAGTSVLPYIYPALQSVGVSPLLTNQVMVLLEIGCVSFGAVFLLRAIAPNLPWISVPLVVTFFSFSWIRGADLANFIFPYFHGQFYGFADGLRLMAIALFFRFRFNLSATFILLAFIIHPIKGLVGGMFIFGAFLASRPLWNSRVLIPFSIVSLAGVVWSLFWVGLLNGDGGNIPPTEFFWVSRILNSHWYPDDLGVFSSDHLRYSTPFFCSILVAATAMMRNPTLPVRQISVGLILLGLLSLLGILVSLYEVHPVLVKLCLQRASVLMLSVSGIVVIAATLGDINKGNWWYSFLALICLGAAFATYRGGWPLVFCVAYSVTFLFDGANPIRRRLPILFLLLPLLCFEIVMIASGYFNFQQLIDMVTGLQSVIVIALVFSLLVALGNDHRHIIPHTFTLVGLLVCSMLGAYVWGESHRRVSSSTVELAKNFKQAQLWAQSESAERDLFIVDPCLAYGWRDYAQRSSFGSISEWYKTGWLYTGSIDAYRLGIARGKELGIHLNMKGDLPSPTSLCETARATFYSPASLSKVVDRNDIDYIVVLNEFWSASQQFSVVYQNASFAILQPSLVADG